MDYTYFPAAQQPQYQMFGLPTPNHLHTPPQTDEFGNKSPPDQFGAPFQTFDNPFRFDPNAAVNQTTSPPESFSKHQGIPASELNGDDQNGDRTMGRSSSEEKDNSTMAQSRRKAQNRAAQRAFRERKERHVRDLEDKLNGLEQASNYLHEDNERLKRELAKIATENEVLRATSNSGPNSTANGFNSPTTTGPMSYTPKDFTSSLVAMGHQASEPTHRITVNEETGERLLDSGATWDMIQSHPLSQQGKVDIADVCERLKGHARCDGQGPVFEEGLIRQTIEESSAAGNDELI